MVGFTDVTATCTPLDMVTSPVISIEDKKYIDALIDKMSGGDKKDDLITYVVKQFFPRFLKSKHKEKGVV
jgi:hypothetical protein